MLCTDKSHGMLKPDLTSCSFSDIAVYFQPGLVCVSLLSSGGVCIATLVTRVRAGLTYCIILLENAPARSATFNSIPISPFLFQKKILFLRVLYDGTASAFNAFLEY